MVINFLMGLLTPKTQQDNKGSGIQIGTVGGDVTIHHGQQQRVSAISQEQHVLLGLLGRVPDKEAVHQFLDREFGHHMVIDLKPSQVMRATRYCETILKRVTGATPETQKSLFMKRLKEIRRDNETHPYAVWATVVDPRTSDSCKALHGKAWRVDGEGITTLAGQHFDKPHKDCRCRVRPVTMRALVAEQIQRMD
jgi:Phage Mu protein F like protein